MDENSTPYVFEHKRSIVWGVLVVVTAIFVAEPGFRALLQGAPLEAWIVDVSLGALLLEIYVATRVAYLIEGDRTATASFGLSDWTILLSSLLWLVVGGTLVLNGFDSVDVLGFTVFGVVGVVAMIYRAVV